MVFAPGEPKRFAVQSAALGAGAASRPDEARAAKVFAEYLFRRGRVDVGRHGHPRLRIAHPAGYHKTHELAPYQGALVLRRRTFDCGFDV
jgi:hypothetical protein